jgi:hypothetical protein
MGRLDGCQITYTVVTNPLNAEVAYWHACTGTPYVEETKRVPLRYDQYATTDRMFYVSLNGPLAVRR